jgi:tetratricopeptide (TPR) repeat protein
VAGDVAGGNGMMTDCGMLTLRARPLGWLLACAVLLGAGSARAAEPVRGEVRVFNDSGYARLVFRLDEHVDASVNQAGAIVVISFKKPVDIPVDRLNAGAPDYISAARRDPDGAAIRLALARKVKVNTIPAGEWLYVDLLPDTWAGVMPGLPQEIIDELARRARDAERQLHKQKAGIREMTPPTIRVRTATQPTFVRYVFEMPDQVNVVPERSDEALTLTFDRPIKWDLGEATAALPPTLRSIESVLDYDSTKISFTLNGNPDVRNFREDRSIVVDIGLGGAKPKVVAEQGGKKPVPEKKAEKPAPAGKVAAATPKIEAPATVPAKDNALAADSEKQAMAAAPAPAAAPPVAAPVAPAVAPAPAAMATPNAAPVAPAPAPAAAPAVDASPTVAPVKPADLPKAEASKPIMAPAATEKPPAPSMAEAKPPAPDPNAPVVVNLRQSGDTLRLEFPFAVPTPAAVFRRADTLWLVFDTAAKINLAALATSETSQLIRSNTVDRGADGEVIIRIKLERPQIASLTADGPSWLLTIGDAGAAPTRPLVIARGVTDKNHASISIPFEHAQKVHRIDDPEVGDRLMVITALGPARGFLKPLDFVELRALPTTQGVVVQPLADDVAAELFPDRITVSRPGGLTLSSGAIGERAANTFTFNPLLFDTQLWGFDRESKFNERQDELVRVAAMAPNAKRYQARLNLARFYIARDMGAEAKGVLEVALSDLHGDDVTGTVLKGISDLLLHRPEDALKDLSNPMVGSQLNAPTWRAVALAREGKWTEARQQFKNMEAAMGTLPIELQRMTLREALRSAIEVHDFNGAARMFDEFDTIGVPPELEASMAVLTGKLDEGLGRTEDALAAYRLAADSRDRRAASQGRLRELVLRYTMGDVPRKDAIGQLETLTTVWRGDDTEAEGLKLLAHLYTEDSRYREAFHVMRTAMTAHPNSDLTRQIQDEAATSFESLFLGGKGDALPPVEALGLFYDYRELTPIGRRGDEMIRKLADRLVSVDLLDQAAELLQHQVDHRLQGAARAQVATRLAVIYLMNRKPDRALSTLQTTRTAELSNESRDQRMLLEARALSDIGRHNVALEVIANLQSHEAIRLRADILWAAKRWRQSAEQIELLYGDRWKQFTPLTESERADILRAAIGYSLANETISLARLREKYAAKMADGPDNHAFDVVSSPVGASGAEFQDVAKTVAGVGTLDGFLRDMRARYPDLSTAAGDKAAQPPAKPKPKPGPQAKAVQPSDEKAAANAPVKPSAASSPLPPKQPGAPKADPSPTGSISRMIQGPATGR